MAKAAGSCNNPATALLDCSDGVEKTTLVLSRQFLQNMKTIIPSPVFNFAKPLSDLDHIRAEAAAGRNGQVPSGSNGSDPRTGQLANPNSDKSMITFNGRFNSYHELLIPGIQSGAG
jgi:hypothetical protein